MKLMTKAIQKILPPLYATENVPLEEKVAIVKFFGGSRGTWYGVEGDPATGEFFGYVVSPLGLDCDEWGYFNLNELAVARFPPFGLRVQRDLYFKPTKMSEILKEG